MPQSQDLTNNVWCFTLTLRKVYDFVKLRVIFHLLYKYVYLINIKGNFSLVIYLLNLILFIQPHLDWLGTAPAPFAVSPSGWCGEACHGAPGRAPPPGSWPQAQPSMCPAPCCSPGSCPTGASGLTFPALQLLRVCLLRDC